MKNFLFLFLYRKTLFYIYKKIYIIYPTSRSLYHVFSTRQNQGKWKSAFLVSFNKSLGFSLQILTYNFFPSFFFSFGSSGLVWFILLWDNCGGAKKYMQETIYSRDKKLKTLSCIFWWTIHYHYISPAIITITLSSHHYITALQSHTQ